MRQGHFVITLVVVLAGLAGAALALELGIDAGGTPAMQDVGTGGTPTLRETQEIARAVEELGAAKFEDRQAATELLWLAGAAAEGALKVAAKSSDPEVRTRANALLNKWRLGIRPETPAEVLALIDQFRYAAAIEQRRQALVDLQAKGHWQTVLTLIRGHQNVQEKRNLATAIAAEAGKIASSLVEKGEMAQAEEVLELVATSETGLPQLTAFLLLTDRLDDQIAATRQQVSEQPKEEHWTRLAYLLRAKGDLQGALEAAGNTSDVVLRTNLLAEARRWEDAAGFAEGLYRRNTGRLETAAFAATYFQLAGKRAEQQRLLDVILKAAGADRLLQDNAKAAADPFGGNPVVAINHLNTAGKTLLVNERMEVALPLMRRLNPPYAHMILWRQHRHVEALEFVDVTAEKKLNRDWLEKLPIPRAEGQWSAITDPATQQQWRMLLAGQVARQLRELGRKDQVEEIWQMVSGLPAAGPDGGRRLSVLALLAWQLERYDVAAKYAADAIGGGAAPAMLLTTFVGREQGPLALMWYERLLADQPMMERQKAISTAVWMVIANPRHGKPPENWREIVLAARAVVQPLAGPAKAERLVTFGHTCKIRGDLSLAKELFSEAAQANPAASTHLGEMAAAEGDWAGAAKHYGAAVQANPADVMANFLLGHALMKAGDAEGGAKRMRAANLAALAPEIRVAMAGALRDPGMKDEAVRQLGLVCRTALPDSPQATGAAQQIAALVSASDPARSAQAWEQLLLHFLNASMPLNEPQYYMSVAHMMHRQRARAAVAEKNAEAAADEIARCEKIMPAEVNRLVELVPILQTGGMDALADGMFEAALAKHREVIEAFPTSAMYLNNAAWICARCQRKLDQALELVQQALVLAPEEPAYLDTLAEVHFQRGEREAAVAAAEKCVASAPENKNFAARLKHFREDAVKTLDGVEGD